jgi:hypothetical protein
MDTTIWTAIICGTGILVITVHRIMNTAICVAIINSTGIPIITIQKIMNAAVCAAVISGTGIFVVAAHRNMNTAICTVIISGTGVTVVTAYCCIKNCSITRSQINIGVRVPNFFRHAEISIYFKWFPCRQTSITAAFGGMQTLNSIAVVLSAGISVIAFSTLCRNAKWK